MTLLVTRRLSQNGSSARYLCNNTILALQVRHASTLPANVTTAQPLDQRLLGVVFRQLLAVMCAVALQTVADTGKLDNGSIVCCVSGNDKFQR